MTICLALITPDSSQKGPAQPVDERIAFPTSEPELVWKTCQGLVDGYIEIVRLTPFERTPENGDSPFAQGWHLAAYVNEDGIARGMRPNLVLAGGQILVGPVVFVHQRVDGEGESHYRDITEDDWEKIKTLTRVLIPHTDEARKRGIEGLNATRRSS